MTLMEMAFAGNCAISVDVPEMDGSGDIGTLFSEEAGLVIEVSEANADATIAAYRSAGVPCVEIGNWNFFSWPFYQG